MAAMSTYAQTSESSSRHTQRSVRVGNKTYLREDGSLVNKASSDVFESQYKGKNRDINQQRIMDATTNLKITNTNAELLNLFKSVFSSTELSELKNETLVLILKIDNQGKIFYVAFLGTEKNGSKLSEIDLTKYSLLEDKLMSTVTFRIPDSGIFVYTITVPIHFSNVISNSYVFPEMYYMRK